MLPSHSSASTNTVLTYDNPAQLTATIYPLGAASPRPLFKFKRTATRTGNTIHVLREFTYPDGKPAAMERVVYRNNSLVHYELDALQTGAKGSADIDPAKDGTAKLVFRYAKNSSANPGTGMRNETFTPDMLINDMIGPFLVMHWDQLARGEKVGCRMIVASRRETIGFVLRKESEGQWHGQDVLILKMEPSSLLISAMLDPLHFVIQRNSPHHVLQYTGRTTPKQGSPGHWTDLDAVTVYDW